MVWTGNEYPQICICVDANTLLYQVPGGMFSNMLKQLKDAGKEDKLKAEAAKWATQEEDVLTYAMFPQVAPKFFEKRNAKKQGVDGDHVDYTNQSHPV